MRLSMVISFKLNLLETDGDWYPHLAVEETDRGRVTLKAATKK